MKYIVMLDCGHPGPRYWLEQHGWATSRPENATAYDKRAADQLAQQMHGFAIPA